MNISIAPVIGLRSIIQQALFIRNLLSRSVSQPYIFVSLPPVELPLIKFCRFLWGRFDVDC
ncbi:hypothetical protein D0A37_25010 [Microcoleus vaginatus HSN003]|nr:hypothetical protein D0A37_25010 [Microcoleus vaginatus HSN003]